MPKSVTRTLRLDEDLDRAIQTRAKESSASVNFMVNRLIRKYVEWDVPAQKFGLGPVAGILVNRLIDEVDEAKAYEIGRWVAKEFFVPFTRYLFGALSFEATILTFRRAAEYGYRYTFDTSSDTKNRIIILRHAAGRKVSMLYAGIMKGLYSDALKMECNVEASQEYCIAQVRLQPS